MLIVACNGSILVFSSLVSQMWVFWSFYHLVFIRRSLLIFSYLCHSEDDIWWSVTSPNLQIFIFTKHCISVSGSTNKAGQVTLWQKNRLYLWFNFDHTVFFCFCFLSSLINISLLTLQRSCTQKTYCTYSTKHQLMSIVIVRLCSHQDICYSTSMSSWHDLQRVQK